MKQLPLSPELQTDVQQVHRTVMTRLQSQAAVFTVAAAYTPSAGDRRLHAALVLLAAQLGTYSFEQVIHAATTVELIHAATLVHDDLVSEANRRRDAIPTDDPWEHSVALMVGDYLFAVAASEMALAPDTRIITYFSDAVMSISEGKLLPVTQAMPLEVALEQYYINAGCKTAALFAAACKAGMACGGGSDEQIDALGHFGYDFGLAFQMYADIRDIASDPNQSGSTVGHSLRRGTMTLPFLYAVAASGGKQLTSLIDADDGWHIEHVIAEVQRLGLHQAQADAHWRAERAMSHLSFLFESAALQDLGRIVSFVLDNEA